MNKKEMQNAARAKVMSAFPQVFADEFTQIDAGAFVTSVKVGDTDLYVEVKFVVKGDSFDLFDATVAYEDKLVKAGERAAAKEAKMAEAAKKAAEKEAKAAEKEKKAQKE